MKRLYITLFALACLFLNVRSNSIFVISDISYKKIDDKSVMVCAKDSNYSAQTFKDSTLNIPAFVNYEGKKFKVTLIGKEAFAKCCGIKRINISNGIEEIQYAAFEACANLEEIKIPSSVRVLEDNLLSFCVNLSSIKIDNKNRIYDSRENCNAIIRKQDKALLYGCKNTKIPSSVEYINDFAFYGCLMESVVIPNGVKRIKHYAFCECPFLKSIHLSSTVEQIDYPSFYGCGNISQISVDKSNPIYDSRNNCNAIIDKDAEMLVLGCSSTIIPSNISEIGEYAFSYSANLQSIAIPEKITTIKESAFYRCSALKHVSLPSTLKYFDGHTHFGYCVSLESIIIPQKVKELPNDIFMGCVSLQSVAVDSNNEIYDSRNNCNAIIRTKNDELVAGCKGSTIVDGIKYISENSFFKSGITSLHIPASVVDIDYTAFRSCELCMAITVDKNNKYYQSGGANTIIDKENGKLILACSTSAIGTDIKSIGSYAFLNTPNVLILPSGIKEISECAFADCNNLCSIFIPSTVQRIGRFAFAGCKQLSNVIIMGTCVKIDKDAFKGCPNYIKSD